MLLCADEAVAQEQLAHGSGSHAASSSGDKVQVTHCHSCPPLALPTCPGTLNNIQPCHATMQKAFNWHCLAVPNPAASQYYCMPVD